MRRPLAFALLVVLAGCRHEVVPLHRRPSLAGTVRIEVEGGGMASAAQRRIEGELVFDRAGRNLQWVVRGDLKATTSLVRKENGEVEAFTNGVPRLATAQELEDFALVKAVVEPEPAPLAVQAVAADSYTVDLGGRRVRVSTIETIKAHGQR